ncbi:transmembrane protein 223-like [Mercenaria mercenaria]|uniref:transmembrane protein 223-like n=1 Tax=Mercenaria mercenaria TaxID=6596 RepID=UPI001E1D4FFA|nr:transmembrane protein 223-like [Mercenaria mercenaria]
MNQLRNRTILSAGRCYPLFSQMKCFTKSLQTTRHLITTPLSLPVKRSFTTETSRRTIPKKFKKPLLPFEIETNAVNDILLFTYHKKERLVKLISFGGLFLCCVLLNSSELTYRFIGHFKTAPSDEVYPWYYWWKSINFDSNIIKIGAAGFIGCFAFVVLGFSLAYPTRMVREITLLKGGEKILLQTYRPFGMVKAQEVSLKDVSALWGPKEAKSYLPLKIRGKKFPLLVSQDGLYHNKTLFDQTVGLYRF